MHVVLQNLKQHAVGQVVDRTCLRYRTVPDREPRASNGNEDGHVGGFQGRAIVRNLRIVESRPQFLSHILCTGNWKVNACRRMLYLPG